MSSSWWTLIRSRLPDPVGGFILPGPERYTSKLTLAAVHGFNIQLQACTDGLQFFQNKGETYMEFFNQAIDILKILVMALGAGLAVWGVINLLEGYGSDNPAANAHVR